MSFINPAEIELLKTKITNDLSMLGKLYKSKEKGYFEKNVDHNLVEGMLAQGWEEVGTLSTKTKLRKPKEHSRKFEDDIWCQLYRLGYRYLNIAEDFKLNYGPGPLEKKQIDVIAIDDESILLVECKSAKELTKPQSFKTEIESLPLKLAGFQKTLEQMFGRGRKIKYIFATRNLRIEVDSADIRRLEETGSYYLNDNTYEYINSLIKSYKSAAHYQFMSMLFRGKEISREKIEVPAIEGFMGNKKYYMFSIEPHKLLKIGFILHRTRANQAELPTYQRLLVPQRLKGISKFISEGGYFPNSIILNFSQKQQLLFDAASKNGDTKARHGVLKIPNAYAIAYIIDGQHRVYGYAETPYKENNTIPVVAFHGLESTEQLKMFMDINENQKAVSPTLRITLEEDLFWNSERADSRMRALRSSIINKLASSIEGPLYNKISIGEDKAELSSAPFYSALTSSGILPKARGNIFETNTTASSLYNTNNQNHEEEMNRSRESVVKFLNACFDYVESNYPEIFNGDKTRNLIVSNRGIFAFISLIGSLNIFESNKRHVDVLTSPEYRFDTISKYIDVLASKIKGLAKDEEDRLLSKLGQGADIYWLRYFQSLINSAYPEFLPEGLSDWRERQDSALQDEGRKLGTEIEKFIKANVIGNLKILYKDDWELEIGSIQRECEKRAREEMEKRYKDNLPKEIISWTDMFFISDYKTIIERYWSKRPEPAQIGFKSFEELFSIDVEHGFNSKAEKTKWISLFNSLRNNWAHEGTKEKGLNRGDVDLLNKIHKHFEIFS